MNVSASVFQERVQTALALVCSTLHLTALPPMSSTCVGMSGYNVQAMRFLRSDCLASSGAFPSLASTD